MRMYKWLLENDAESVVTNLLEHKREPQSRSRFYARKLLSLLMIIYLEPAVRYEDSRGTVRYRQNVTFSICGIKTDDDKTYAKGIAFFDIVERTFLVMLFFLMVIGSLEPLIGAVVLSFILYVILAFIDYERDCNDLHSLERQVRYIGDTQ